MFDLEKLEAAGFEKAMTTEEWETFTAEEAEKYKRPGSSPGETVAVGTVTKDYVLRRGDVWIMTEQNTQSSTASGIPAMITYPEIVVIKSESQSRQVTCDASDTGLILALAAELEKNPAQKRREEKVALKKATRGRTA